MNYGRRGTRKKRKSLTAVTPKFGNFFGTLVFKFAVFAAACALVAGTCAGVGMFMGVIDTAPDVSNIDTQHLKMKKY